MSSLAHQVAFGSSLAIYLACIDNGQVWKKLMAHKRHRKSNKNAERQKLEFNPFLETLKCCPFSC